METRPRKIGKKRLFLVSSILFSFVIGLPFWRKSTEIYRTPLPFSVIEDRAKNVLSKPLVFPCHIHFVVLEERIEDWNETAIREELGDAIVRISEQLHAEMKQQNSSCGGCGMPFVIIATLKAGEHCLSLGVPSDVSFWPCGIRTSKLLEFIDENDNEAVDELLNKVSRGSSRELDDGTLWRIPAPGMYTILSIRYRKYNNFLCSHKLGAKKDCISKAVIGKYRHAWFVTRREDSLIGLTEISVMSDLVVKFFLNGGNTHQSNWNSMEDKGSTLPLSADGKAILSFSLLNAEPKDWIFGWNFKDIELQFMEPVLEALQHVALLKVESQVLYYTPSMARSLWDPNLRKHVVSFENLPFFVNANEWHLDSSSAAAGRSKVLHFAIYIPAAKECPLYLRHPDGSLSETNGFTSPGWGGVVVLNPQSCQRNFNRSIQHLSIQELKPAIDVIIAQIRVLFGLASVTSAHDDQDYVCIPASDSGFTDWEMDILLRKRAAADVASFASTLRSLSHLVESLPNMVIKEEIGNQVRSSLVAASEAEQYASLGFYHAAADSARKARSWAEEAFFQPSIMSLLYLPLEHHFAIYTPFFVPVLLHTVLAAFKEMKRYRSMGKRPSPVVQ